MERLISFIVFTIESLARGGEALILLASGPTMTVLLLLLSSLKFIRSITSHLFIFSIYDF